MAQLFIGNELLAFSQEDCIKNFAALSKTSSDFLVLSEIPIPLSFPIVDTTLISACLFDQRMLSSAELQHYGTLPDLPVLQAQTSALFNTALSKTHSLLGHHQQSLTRSLDSYSKKDESTDS
jgi:hypothetical protein